MEEKSDWKLKLRYGKDTTPYTHYTVLAEGVCGNMVDGFSCPKGNAIMSIKVWAADINEPSHMVNSIGSQIGFEVSGEIQTTADYSELGILLIVVTLLTLILPILFVIIINNSKYKTSE